MSLRSPINVETVRSLRAEIPALRNYYCLNSGGVSSMPQATFSRLRGLQEQEFIQTGAHPDIRADYESECRSLRRELAGLLNAKTEEIALIRAVSEVISFVASALSLKAGDRVILSAEEHKSGYLPWLALKDRLGIEVVALGVTGDDEHFITELQQAITPNTRAICVSHVTSERGIVLPIEQVAAIGREHAIVTVVDAAQSFGAREINTHAIGCDVIAFPAYKWGLGPYGIGAMYVRREIQDQLPPPGSGSGAAEQFDFPPGVIRLHTSAERYQYGARPFALFAAWRISVAILASLGLANIQDRNAILVAEARDALRGVEAVMVTPDQGQTRSGILSVGVPGVSGTRVAEHCLRQHQILCRRAHDDTVARFCFHAFNDSDDIAATAEAIQQLA